jgi:hypothetical protein
MKDGQVLYDDGRWFYEKDLGMINKANEIRLLVTGLPVDASVAEVYQLFSKYGDVSEHIMMRNAHNLNTFGEAFIRMRTLEEAHAAMVGVQRTKLGGRFLSVSATASYYQIARIVVDRQFWDQFTTEDRSANQERWHVLIDHVPAGLGGYELTIWGERPGPDAAAKEFRVLQHLFQNRQRERALRVIKQLKVVVEQRWKSGPRRRSVPANPELPGHRTWTGHVRKNNISMATDFPETYNLRVRFHLQSIPDIILRDLPIGTTMAKLRQMLRNKIPERPLYQQIRLIEDGVLVEDLQEGVQVINLIDAEDTEHSKEHTIYLTIKPIQECDDVFEEKPCAFEKRFVNFLIEREYPPLIHIEGTYCVQFRFLLSETVKADDVDYVMVDAQGRDRDREEAIEALRRLEAHRRQVNRDIEPYDRVTMPSALNRAVDVDQESRLGPSASPDSPEPPVNLSTYATQLKRADQRALTLTSGRDQSVLANEDFASTTAPPRDTGTEGHEGVLTSNDNATRVQESKPTREDVLKWSAAQVEEHLKMIGVDEKHCKVFEEQEIDGEALLAMEQSTIFLKAFELGSVGARLKTWGKIRALQQDVNAAREPQDDSNDPASSSGVGDASDSGAKSSQATSTRSTLYRVIKPEVSS